MPGQISTVPDGHRQQRRFVPPPLSQRRPIDDPCRSAVRLDASTLDCIKWAMGVFNSQWPDRYPREPWPANPAGYRVGDFGSDCALFRQAVRLRNRAFQVMDPPPSFPGPPPPRAGMGQNIDGEWRETFPSILARAGCLARGEFDALASAGYWDTTREVLPSCAPGLPTLAQLGVYPPPLLCGARTLPGGVLGERPSVFGETGDSLIDPRHSSRPPGGFRPRTCGPSDPAFILLPDSPLVGAADHAWAYAQGRELYVPGRPLYPASFFLPTLGVEYMVERDRSWPRDFGIGFEQACSLHFDCGDFDELSVLQCFLLEMMVSASVPYTHADCLVRNPEDQCDERLPGTGWPPDGAGAPPAPVEQLWHGGRVPPSTRLAGLIADGLPGFSCQRWRCTY